MNDIYEVLGFKGYGNLKALHIYQDCITTIFDIPHRIILEFYTLLVVQSIHQKIIIIWENSSHRVEFNLRRTCAPLNYAWRVNIRYTFWCAGSIEHRKLYPQKNSRSSNTQVLEAEPNQEVRSVWFDSNNIIWRITPCTRVSFSLAFEEVCQQSIVRLHRLWKVLGRRHGDSGGRHASEKRACR